MDEIIKILDIKITKTDFNGAVQKFIDLLKESGTSTIYTPNPEIVMMAQEDEELKEVLFNGDLVIPDGIGLIYASKIYNLGLDERVPGIELMDEMIKYADKTKKKIFLLGAKPNVAKKAAKKINKEYKNVEIVGVHHGYFDESEELKVIDLINEKKPDILFVALGASRQEKWISKHKKILNTSVAMGVGGALDVWAGNVKRAPEIFIKMHLEWFYRVLKQPTRIKRLIAIPKFILKVLLNKKQMKGD